MTLHQNVFLKSLRVISARGIRQDSELNLEGLADVNIVFGSNGVGKSTVGLSIYKLLRPVDSVLSDAAELSGQLAHGDEVMDLRVAMSKGRAFLGQDEVDYPAFTSADELSRYRLALEELISRDDVEFAKRIANETRGGIDLKSVEKAVGAAPKAKRPKGLVDDLIDCRKIEEQFAKQHDDLLKEQQGLEELRSHRLQIREELESKTLYEAAQDKMVASGELQNLELEIAELPNALAVMSGGESQRLEELEREVEKCSQALALAKRDEQRIQEELNAFGVDEKLTHASLHHLDELQSQYDTTSKDLENLRNTRDDLEASIAKCVKPFGGEGAAEEVNDRIEDMQWETISALLERRVKLQLNVATLENLISHFSGEEEGKLQSESEEIRRRSAILQAWCGADNESRQETHSRYGSLLLAACLALGVLSVALAVTVNPLWLLTTVIPGILFGLMRKWQVPTHQQSTTRQEIQRVNHEMFPESGEWSRQEVLEALDDLWNAQAEIKEKQQTNGRIAGYRETLLGIENELNNVVADLKSKADALGLELAGIDDELALVGMVRALNRWGEESAELPRVIARITPKEQELSVCRQTIVERLRAFNIVAGSDVESLRADVVSARGIWDRWSEARNELSTCQTNIDHKTENLKRVSDDHAEFLKKFGESGVTPGLLKEYETQLSSYAELSERKADCLLRIKTAEGKLADSPLVEQLSSAEIDEKLSDLNDAQDRLEDVMTKIRDIENEIEQIQQGTQLTDALSRREAKETELQDHFGETMSKLASYSVLDWLVRETEGENASVVFNHAKANLDRITQGKMTLAMNVTSEGEQFVINDALGKQRQLDSLSVGERVQVLLAVRMAFLSSGETAALPIVVDEALGTSDDQRAREIIGALVELAKGGRQIFYFTAQSDEVQKWQDVLSAQQELSMKVVDLDNQRSISADEYEETVGQDQIFDQVPNPHGMSHAKYGEVLRISRVNVESFDVDRLPLWYVLEDVESIYTCQIRRIHTVSQLRHSLDRDEVPVLSKEIGQLAIGRAKALAASVEVYRNGNPAKVRFEHVQNSEAVTDRWCEEVWELAKQCDCNGEQVVAALGDRALKGWQQKNTGVLENEFRSAGLILDQDPPSPNEIESAATAVMAAHGLDVVNQTVWLLEMLQFLLGDYQSVGGTDG